MAIRDDVYCHTIPVRARRSSVALGWTSVLVEHRIAPAGRKIVEPAASHDYQLVLRITDGTRTELFENGRWTGDVYEAGSLALLGGGESCRARYAASGPDHVGVFVIPHRIMAEAAEVLRRPGRPAPVAPRHIPHFDHPGVAATGRALLVGVARGLPDLYAEQATHWLALQLLTMRGLATTELDRRGPTGSLTDARLSSVLDLIRSSVAEPLTLDRLAAAAGISKFHFSRVFRARTGATPMAYVERVRLTAAARLLRQTDDPVAAVARATGYAGPDQFGAAFRRQYSMSPTAYRRS